MIPKLVFQSFYIYVLSDGKRVECDFLIVTPCSFKSFWLVHVKHVSQPVLSLLDTLIQRQVSIIVFFLKANFNITTHHVSLFCILLIMVLMFNNFALFIHILLHLLLGLSSNHILIIVLDLKRSPEDLGQSFEVTLIVEGSNLFLLQT